MHPNVEALLGYFTYDHLPQGSAMRQTSARCGELAKAMAEQLPESPEVTAGMRKLLEAKDCFVRASLRK
jgi:hypothetical protein